MKILYGKDNVHHTHTLLNIFGLKISIRKNKKKQYVEANKNYEKVLKRIQNKAKNEKIKVVFLVTELSKWGCQSLYDKLDAHPNFEPLILVTLLTNIYNKIDLKEDDTNEIYDYFKNKGMNVDYAYKNGKYLDLKIFKPDIVFYQQPWQTETIQFPTKVSKYALCCYIGYCIAASPTSIKKIKPFYYTLWKHFLAHECVKEELLEIYEYNKNSLCVTGHPKLELYRSQYISNENNKHYVIYAPHHSVKDSLLNYATFDWSGEFMLEYAKKHPEINWLFRPHPNLKPFFIKSGYMTEEKINKYFEEWANLGEVSIGGSYFDKFAESDCMITDCGSFLVEYLFSKKPIIHMISKKSEKQSALNQIVSENYYIVKNKDTLEKYLDEILIKRNDFLFDVRQKKINEIFNEEKKSSDIIVEHLEETLLKG